MKPPGPPAGSTEFAAAALGCIVAGLGERAAGIDRLRLGLAGGGEGASLARTAQALEGDGWLLGLFAAELGGDVLFLRHDPRGLSRALELAGRMLALEGRAAHPAQVPDLAAETPTGLREARALCVSMAWIAYASGVQDARWTLKLSGDSPGLEIHARPAPGLERALLGAARRIQGTRLWVGERAARLELPSNLAAPERP